MVNAKETIEKIWWAIPPVVIVFGVPFCTAINEMVEFSHPPSLFISCYGKHFLCMIGRFIALNGLVAISTFGCMSIGYYLSKRKSLPLRIIVPTIFEFGGFLVSYLILAMMYTH